jgi:two-component system, OmpR family, phosphate regulon response regulator PhoB
MTQPQRLLVVDDEPDLQQLLAFNLVAAGFAVEVVTTGAAGIEAALRERPAVVILDLMLPDISGTEVCRRLRAEEKLEDVGILMLTARGDEYDRVLGFEVGADDYVVKPFSVRELVLRVRALARRSNERDAARRAKDAGTRLVWRGLSIDPVRHRVFSDGEEMSLRPLEYKLLAIFLERPGVVFTRAELLEEVWGVKPETQTRTVDTHIRRLRERLEKYGDAIETVPGFGYRLRDA